MSRLDPLMSSANPHYCSPPEVVTPMRRVLIPKGSGRRLGDFAANDGSIVGANFVADGQHADGLAVDWSAASSWYCNPPYGRVIPDWTARMSHFGRTVGVPGIGLLPARTDTRWAREDIFGSADAWVFVDGRLTFWVPVPLTEAEDPRMAAWKGSKFGPYCLRRWYSTATRDNLPHPFRLLADGTIIGPELGENGRPQAAPFPSMIPFWADLEAHESNVQDELEALRELVRGAAADMRAMANTEQREGWLAEAEAMLGSKRFADSLPMRMEVFDRLGPTVDRGPHPIDVRTFARHFARLGTLVVARGRYRGVYRHR